MQKKLLIIHQGALGDIVSIFTAIIRLKEKLRQIDIICKKSIGELTSFLKLTDKYHPAESALFSSLFSYEADHRIVDILRPYDEIILFSFSEELEITIARLLNKKIYRFNPRPDASSEIHVLNNVMGYLFQNGLISDTKLTATDYFPESVRPANNPCDRLKIFIHPGSGSLRKNWKLHNFIKVFEKIRSLGMNPEIITGPAEENLAGIMAESLPAGTKIHNMQNLLDLAKLLSQAGGFIGNDSGISHLAAFTGIPTVVIFGPSSPKRWAPFGRSVEVLRPATDCTPCFETEKSNCTETKCLELTTPDMVVETLLRIHRK
ncbi:MAG: hypothetical protein EHM85_17970 [Desulfobacteraceae bacterium]|nr:MAG: hypothetical protein EHM85_17970 [Desulfobacteraceae bacterium]